MLTTLTKNLTTIKLMVCLALLLSACAPAEAEVAQNELPATATTSQVTVVALQPVASPTATLPNTATAVAPSTPTAQPTTTPAPSNTPVPTVEDVSPPTSHGRDVDVTEIPLTVEPIEVTQIVIAPTATPMPSNARAPITVPSSLQPLVDQIVADIISRTNADRSAITLISYEAVTWSNGAIGCPEPGMAYTQALIDGYRLVFDANGRQMLYHTSGTNYFTFCDTGKVKPEKPVPGGSGGSGDT